MSNWSPVDLLARCRRRHHRRKHHHTRSIRMAVSLNNVAPGNNVTLTAVALEGDNVTPDPNAPTLAWTIDDPSLATITDNHDGTALVTAVDGAAGTATIGATATDPDGNTVTAADPEIVTIAAPNTDAKSVVITAGVPF